MLSLIINWTNIVWGATLAVACLGVKKYTEMTTNDYEEMQMKLDKVRGVAPISVILLGVWLSLRCLYALGFLLPLEFLLVIGVMCYVHRKESRREARLIHQAHWLLQNKEDLKSILGDNLPEWLKYPSVSRAIWLNTMISGMWSSIALATETSLRQFMEPLLKANKPSFIYDLLLKECSIGNNPIVINGIQHFPSEEDITVIDVTISWDSDMGVHLHVSMPGPDMHVYVRGFQISMQVRFELSPHIPQWPCFAAISLSIMKIWTLDFDISAAGISLDSVPAVGEFLDQFIRNTVIGMLQHPKRMTFPIVNEFAVETTRADVALGSLRIRLLRIEDWCHQYQTDRKKTPFYVKVTMVENNSPKRRKSAIYTGLDSELGDEFSFVLFDKAKTLRFWLYFDVPGIDPCVGECDVPVQVLLDNNLREHACRMVKSSMSSNTSRAKLIISSEFLPYANRGRADSTTPPTSAPSRSVSDAFVKEREFVNCPLSLPTSRSLKAGSSSHSEGGSGGGTLFVTVDRCAGLKNMEHVGVSDPYVQLRLRNQVRRSPYVKSTLDPKFNFETELEVYDAQDDVLSVVILDKNSLTKDRVMGSVNIPIREVAACVGDKLNREWNLDPKGKLYMSIRLLRH